jgi:ABC-2 type transport system ATP-binding protein
MKSTDSVAARPALEAENLGREFGGLKAVDGLSFSVAAGEIVGLVGCNGAGKTTTMRALSGILRPTSGQVRVGSFDVWQTPAEAKRRLAYIPDTIHPYDLLTVEEHLQFIALAYRVENFDARAGALLEELNLSHKRNELASSLSRGMQQKLSLACAFLRDPAVIILDEPLTGLDPVGIRNIKESIRRRAADGTSFLISSHLLHLVEALCDRVMIMHRGRKVAMGSSLDRGAAFEDIFLAVTDEPSDAGFIHA